MSEAALALIVTMKDEASSGISSLTSSLGGLGTIAGGAAVAGVVAFGAALAGGVQDAQESRRLMAETETILKNLGDAAGVSADEVADMASALSDAAGKSLFGDDQIQAAENMLLKFKEIKVPLVDVTQLATDMAQTLGTAPADAAKTLGMALQSPFDAAAKLAKQGIILTDTQKNVLEQFKATGDAAGAQQVLVDALNATYGGQAEAAAKAAGGMVQFKAGLGEAFETLGSKLLPVLDRFGAWLNSPEVQQAIGQFAERLARGIEVAADFVINDLIPAIERLYNWLAPMIGPIITEVARALEEDLPRGVDRVVTAWNTMEQALSDFKTGYIDPIVRGWNEVTAAVSGAYDWFVKLGDSLPSIQIPSWLQGHSPPPMAEWLTAIGESAASASITMDRFLAGMGGGAEQGKALLESIDPKQMADYMAAVKDTGDTLNDSLTNIPKNLRGVAEAFAAASLGKEAYGAKHPEWFKANAPGANDMPPMPAMASGGGAGVTVNVTVMGSVKTEQDLVYAIRDGLVKLGLNNTSIFGGTVIP